MRVYETILSILEKKGPLSIPTICQEVNQVLTMHSRNPIFPSRIQSIVTRKKDLFRIIGDTISIQPDKYPILLTASLEGIGGISYHVKVNFEKNTFVSFEWRNNNDCQPFSNLQSVQPGNLDEFKCILYMIDIWNWEPSYRKESGIILDGKSWNVRLETTGKIYQSAGIDSFPPNWEKFCSAVEKLIGTPFS